MDIRDRRTIRNTAAEALAAVPGDPRKTVLFYAGGTALLALLSTVISYIAGVQIEGTGGLGNMGLRSILATVQAVLPLFQSVVVIFLGFGYQSAVLRMARRQSGGPDVLLDGFRRFGPLLRLMMLEFAIYSGLMFLALYAGSQIFLMTPLANDFIAVMMPVLESASALTTQVPLDDATLMAATEAMLPMFPIAILLFAIVGIPIVYQYRMATFSLLDNPGRGALAALRESRGMMRGNRVSLFRLDLSFWWFYTLELLVMVLCYGDTLLPMAGVTFPWSDTVSYFLFYIASLALQTGIYLLFLNRVHVTYATVYETLRPEPQQNSVPLGNIFHM